MNLNVFSNLSCHEELFIKATLMNVQVKDVLKKICKRCETKQGNVFFTSFSGKLTFFDADGNVIEDSEKLKVKGGFDCSGLNLTSLDGYPKNIYGTLTCDNNPFESVQIPDSVTKIGYGAFNMCTSLESVQIPDSVTSIGEYAFYNCTSLKSIEIPSSVRKIGHGAFYMCTSLKSIEIPDSVTSIGDSAFDECTSLKTIEIPSSVTSIGKYAFYNCISLETIKIPSSVTSIGDSAFDECTSLKVTFQNADYKNMKNYPFGLKPEQIALGSPN